MPDKGRNFKIIDIGLFQNLGSKNFEVILAVRFGSIYYFIKTNQCIKLCI